MGVLAFSHMSVVGWQLSFSWWENKGELGGPGAELSVKGEAQRGRARPALPGPLSRCVWDLAAWQELEAGVLWSRGVFCGHKAGL